MTGQTLDQLLREPGLVVVYDGQCPFCSAYVEMLRLRQSVGIVALVDARTDIVLVAECELRGFSLNDGMLALLAGRTYFGADAVSLLSRLTTGSTLLNRATAAVLMRPSMARVIYPVMRSGRSAALALMGRSKL